MWITTLFIAAAATAQPYDEPYRPQYHFTPRKGWIGDPNGLLKFEGIYHLFWWGHATSTDLVHWTEQPHPMKGDDGSFHYFTGSVVIDQPNSTGLGSTTRPAAIAIYTAHHKTTGAEDQRISISSDLRRFDYFAGNPVLDIGSKSFRDPDVFWHGPTSRWVMAITLPEERKVRFYSSKDLKTWTAESDFGPIGARSQVWEVPNLFEMAFEGKKKWILTCGMGPNRVQYFIGDFDGKRFKLDRDIEEFLKKPAQVDYALWLDAGSDFYAARTYRNYDGGEHPPICMAWMGNWDYARDVPTMWGKGQQSLPRILELFSTPAGLRLRQRPLPELEKLRGQPMTADRMTFSETIAWKNFAPAKNCYELTATFEITSKEQTFGLNLCSDGEKKVAVGFDSITSTVFLDRHNSGNVDFSQKFPRKISAVLEGNSKTITFRIFVDQSSIEVFINDGEVTLSSLIFPDAKAKGVELFSNQGETLLLKMTAWELTSIWKK